MSAPLQDIDSAALRVEEVGKSYGSVQALKSLSLHVNAGEFVALLGPNGAGKSTLFQLLSGLFVADRGSIRIEELDIRDHGVAALARLGIVFQQPTLDLDLSVRANLRFHALLHGMGKVADRRIGEELQRQNLSDQAGRGCRSLSGGNRRRVELARALLHRPRVLLMDEATVGLDPASRSGLVDHVHELCGHTGMAVLWATHLVDEAERADRVLVLHQGNLLWDGAPNELIGKTGQKDLSAAFLSMTTTRDVRES